MQEKTTSLQNAIMLATIIGSIMSNYDPAKQYDRKKPILVLRARLKKFMYQRSRSNQQEFLKAVMCADAAWRNAVNYFAEQKLAIETVSTIVRLYDLYAEPLSKFANIHDKQIEAFATNMSENATLELEQNSYEVSDYILNELAVFTGIQRVSKFKRGN